MDKKALYIPFMILYLFSCRDDSTIEEIELEEEPLEIEIPDWADDTHSNLAEPNYDMVFPQHEVLRFDIKIEAEHWQDMQANLSVLMGSTGGGPPGAGAVFPDENPIYVPCSFYFGDKEWYKVGIRYKGNSSLYSIGRSNSKKYSFKLDFDEFEDTYPAIDNQRFYGFRQLNLCGNFKDESLLREKVAADLYREFGIPAAKTSFCAVYIDYGYGSQYFGLYTLIEEVDDTVLESQLGSDEGNLYKPDGDAATFAQGTYNETEFEKKNNEDIADYSDVHALYTYLNSSTRTSDPELWKSDLQSVLDVDHFLKWLAANIVMQNWDTYGNMSHNYFLYNDPSTQLLTWIPWDNNESLRSQEQSGGGSGGGGVGKITFSLSLNEVGSDWPLINYLISVDEYKEKYDANVENFSNEVFEPSKVIGTYSEYYELIKDYVYAEEYGFSFLSSDADFDNGVEYLKTHVQSRHDAVAAYLGN